MEFCLGTTTSVPKFRWESDPDAEHTAIMQDLEYYQLADTAGFKYASFVEHHFLDEYSHMSASDVCIGYIAHATTQIHLLSGIFNPLPTVNHPAKVAERVAMLDHITQGRFEFGTGRGAGSHEILGFLPDVTDLNETKLIWDDVIREIPKMWLQDVYEGHSSKYWSLPPRRVLPRMWKPLHPAMWYAAGNVSSWTTAARMGLGVLGFSIDTLDTAATAIETYKKEIVNVEPIGAYANDYLMSVNFASVSEDREEAIKWVCSRENAYYMSILYRYHDTFPRPPFVPRWPDVMNPFTREEAEMMIEAGACIGDPDDAIRCMKRWEATGVDGIFVGAGHVTREHALSTIKLFGEYVIPEFDKDPVHRTTRLREDAAAAAGLEDRTRRDANAG